MSGIDINSIQWLEPWVPIETVQRKSFEAELQREVKPGHLLYQVEVKAVARRLDCDDVLFALTNHSSALAVVHLTYSVSEVSPQWPHTLLFDSVEEWVENCMKPDHQDYQ